MTLTAPPPPLFFPRGIKRLKTAVFAVCGALVLALSGCNGADGVKDLFGNNSGGNNGNKTTLYTVTIGPVNNGTVTAHPVNAAGGPWRGRSAHFSPFCLSACWQTGPGRNVPSGALIVK
ncbi:MAG: hypothetical protein LBF83_07330 [Spirochaetaceae bacterium]|nr:hypothetical protein [Spirochaetaceae bacterium]